MGKITGFTFFSSYHESLKDLETEDRRELLEAIVNYVFDDIEPEFSGFKKTIWTLIVPNLTTSKNKSKNAQKEIKPKQRKNKSKTKSSQKSNNELLDDKEENKERKGKEDEDNTCSTTRSIYSYVEENFGRPLSPIEFEKINEWEKEYSDDIIEYAVMKSVLYNKRTFNYVNGILRNWKSNGFRSLQEIKDNEIKITEDKNKPVKDLKLFDYNWLEDNE